MTRKPTYYQQLRTIPMPIIEARLRLLWQLQLKFERAGDERVRELNRRGIKITGDIFHIDKVNDRELQRLMRGYLHYHSLYGSMRINESALRHEVFKYTGDIYTDKSVAELEEAHLAVLRVQAEAARARNRERYRSA